VYKNANKGGKWDEAVDATRGWVLVRNGKPFKAFYASTAGGRTQSYTIDGYSTPGLWDTTGDWTKWADGAYEGKGKGESPWFYKAWYKSRSGDSCGRSHPWLTEAEFADVLNAWVVRYKGGSGDVARVTPLGSCNGGNPFSMDEMKNKANEYGGAFTSVSSVRVEHGSDGYTKTVIVQTNRGEVRVAGPEFKTAFNLRAPARISVKGNLFGIEKK
jgi:peptidoglycan hydrolase-like amidase